MKRLTAAHYEELLELLNYVFGHEYGHEMDFLKELPVMWQKDDVHMQHHIGIFEDDRLVAVVGIYPLPARIGDRDFLFATVGNMATAPQAEGKGYMSLLYTTACEELTRMGVDMARLGGARQRYERFGFITGGTVYRYLLNGHNCRHCFPDVGDTVTFRRITAEDTAALDFCHRLHHATPCHVKRRREDCFLTLGNKQKTPYLALEGDTPIGYLCASDDGCELGELEVISPDKLPLVLCGWQKRAGTVKLSRAPYRMEENALLSAVCDDMTAGSPSRFKILSWQPLLDSLMKLKASCTPLPQGEMTLCIRGYGALRLYVREDEAGCEPADEADVTLSPAEATRLLTEVTGAYIPAAVPPACRAWFPLPLSWDTVDAV